VAASDISNWTDAEAAMRWVGERLGIFGAGRVASDLALSTDSRLRRSLFDVLLSLVEGGAADIRRTDNGYEFRTRAGDEIAWLAPAGPSIDLVAPAPWSGEYRRVCEERDDALQRAAVAEAVAAERERLLRECFSALNRNAPPTAGGGEGRGDRRSLVSKNDDSPDRASDVAAPRVENGRLEARRTRSRILVAASLVLVAALLSVAAVFYVLHRPPTSRFLPDALSSSRGHENVTAAVTFALAVIALATTWFVLRRTVDHERAVTPPPGGAALLVRRERATRLGRRARIVRHREGTNIPDC
jgi:hypothetical protein